jgi:histidinol-phosphate aminotransferase
MSNELPIRKDLAGRTAYGAPQLNLPVQLNTNENPFPLSDLFMQDLSSAISGIAKNLNRYPDRDAISLRAELASYISSSASTAIDPGQVWAANGSNEILQQICQLFGGPDRFAVGFVPSYSVHELIAQTTCTDWKSIPRNESFEIDSSSLSKLEKNSDIVFICTPNNPTGTKTSLQLIKEVHDHIQGIVVVDEAYAEFSEDVSAITLLEQLPRLLVVRTMSKAFALAGVRIGYLVASKDVIDSISLVRLPYHLSALTQAAGLVALKHQSQLAEQVKAIIVQRERIEKGLVDLGLKVAPSSANFVLFGEFADNHEVWRKLADRGVLIRDVGIEKWLRVTAGTEAETTKFLAELSKIVPTSPKET